ncbi:MAG: tetratricopeptide repeat protein, partial [Opitutae bacterium]|nr:tetratricopeptide repeat protein [Opitutae bacterium]
LKLGQPRKAVYNLRQCLDIDPDNVPASYALGISFLGYGDSQRARRAFEKVLEKDPDHPQAREKLAQLEQKAD